MYYWCLLLILSFWCIFNVWLWYTCMVNKDWYLMQKGFICHVRVYIRFSKSITIKKYVTKCPEQKKEKSKCTFAKKLQVLKHSTFKQYVQRVIKGYKNTMTTQSWQISKILVKQIHLNCHWKWLIFALTFFPFWLFFFLPPSSSIYDFVKYKNLIQNSSNR